MGDFLSQPDKTKHSDDGRNEFLRYGSCGMQGWRKRMEDAHITDISKGNNKRFQIFGVFDGHGGKEVSQFVKNHFTEEFLKWPETKNGNIKAAIKKTFLRMDELMQTANGKRELNILSEKSKKEDEEQDKRNENTKNKRSDLELLGKLINEQRPKTDISMMVGCTACVCIIDILDKRMYFANAGDSRAVLCKNGIGEAMSIDHKPDLEEERNRIYNAGGWITEGRIKGNLNLSRGFGDLEYKQKTGTPPEEQMITANPDIKIVNLDNQCEFIIIGCDGIWDCLKNQEACEIVRKGIISNPNGNLSKIIENMMDKICAIDLGSNGGLGCDNMTCIIIDLKQK